MRLRNYLQKQKSKLFEYSQRFREREKSFLRRKDKGTWILLYKDVSTCFYLAMAIQTLGILHREKVLSIYYTQALILKQKYIYILSDIRELVGSNSHLLGYLQMQYGRQIGYQGTQQSFREEYKVEVTCYVNNNLGFNRRHCAQLNFITWL